MTTIKSTPFSFLSEKEFSALEGFVWLLIHGNNSLTEQTFIISMISKLIEPLCWVGIGYAEYHCRTERELRTYPNGKPPLLTE